MASGAALVDFGQDGSAADGHDAVVVMLGERFAEILLDAGHFHWWKKFTVGELRHAVGWAANSRELFDVVVPGREIGITNRPIHRDAVLEVGFEVEVAPAVALASPGKGLAADLTPADPGKMFSRIAGVGIFGILNEELVGVLVAGVIALALNVLRFGALFPFVPAAKFQFPRRDVLDIILFGLDGAASFQNQRVEALFGKFFGSPTAGDSRSNDDCVITWCRHFFSEKFRRLGCRQRAHSRVAHPE